MSHTTMRYALAVAALPLVLAACQGGTQPSRFRTFDPGVVRLYDMGAPDGMIEIELDRNGWIREMEADIPIDSLPPTVRAAAEAAARGAMITGAELEMQQGGDFWEVKMRHEGRDIEFVLDDRGNIHETERELATDEAPIAVLHASQEAIPDSKFKSVEVIEKGAMREYHVKRTRDGASYKVVLEADGTVKRAVREHRAEIEIPLK